MRIDRLDLLAFGRFSNQTLTLSQGHFGLHLIYGDNEAGKSTSLRALTALLFGIHPRTTDNFLHTYDQLRIGGKLKLASGSELEFIRRKGSKDTIQEFDTQTPLDDSVLLPFLPGGMDEKLFTTLYGIDYAKLVAGGQELLSQSGDLGQALFSAAVGTAEPRALMAKLKNEAGDLFKPRGKKMLLNQAHDKFKEAMARIKATSLLVDNWNQLNKDLEEALIKIKEVDEEIEIQSRAKSRLDRLNRVKGVLAERRLALSQLAEIEDVLLLPEDFEEQRKTASDNYRNAGEEKERAETRLARLKDEACSLNVRKELLENERAISNIFKKLGAYEKAIEDGPGQDGKRRLLRNEASELLQSIRPELKLDEAQQLRPLLNQKKWVSELAKKFGLLAQKKETVELKMKGLSEELEQLKNERNQQPPPLEDLAELKAAIATARKPGDLEKRLIDSQEQLHRSKANLDDELARLGKYAGTVEALAKMAMPLAETLDLLEKELDELSDQDRNIRRRQRELQVQKKGFEGELKALLANNIVPTLAELNESREHRNQIWITLKAIYIEKNTENLPVSDFPPETDLPTHYEKKVQTADLVSDQLRQSADKVVKRADLETKIEQLHQRSEDLINDADAVKASLQAHRKNWAAVWSPLGIDPGTPREMKQWLLRVEKFRENAQSLLTITSEEQNLAAEYQKLKQVMALQIGAFNSSTDLQGKSLEAMILLCEQRVEQEEKAAARKGELERLVRDTRIREGKSADELNAVQKEQSNWFEEWSQAIDGMAMNAKDHPEKAMVTFEQLGVFFERFDKSEELRRRIYGIDQVKKEFEKEVFDFADSIGFPREDNDAGTLAALLNRDLNEAREARASSKKIQAQHKEVEADIADATIRIRTSEEQLSSLMEEAGVKHRNDLVLAGENSSKKREIQQKLTGFEQELARNGDGLSIEALEQEASGVEVDSIESSLAKISDDLKDLNAKRDALRDERQTHQNRIDAQDGKAVAAKASEEAEQHLADMASGVEKYLHLQIASLLLEQRIEDYRKKNQAPALARASELFAQLTLGSFAGLRDEIGEGGKPTLFGVRGDNKEVPVEGMSEGSRDQLYLSLRLATLEQHLEKSKEPIPFIVDDILIGFDDDRTKVCIEVLADLAAKTQVLLFTHHRRVLEIGNTLKAEKEIFIHELVSP